MERLGFFGARTSPIANSWLLHGQWTCSGQDASLGQGAVANDPALPFAVSVVVMSLEDFEAEQETLAILADEDLMAQIRRSMESLGSRRGVIVRQDEL